MKAAERLQRARIIIENRDRPRTGSRKSCVSTAVSFAVRSRTACVHGASDDTCNNDRSSWQLPSQRLVTPSSPLPPPWSLSAELSFSSWTAKPVVQPRDWLEYYTILITQKCASSRPPLIADRLPPRSLARSSSSSFLQAAVLVSRHEEAPRDTPRKLGLWYFFLVPSRRALWPSWGCSRVP